VLTTNHRRQLEQPLHRFIPRADGASLEDNEADTLIRC
jgi:hypothetical protein